MIALTVAALFTIVAIATALSLVDSWIRGRSAYTVLRREEALLKSGFVPQVEPYETRLRHPAKEVAFGRAQTARSTARRSLAGATRGAERAIPLPDCA